MEDRNLFRRWWEAVQYYVWTILAAAVLLLLIGFDLYAQTEFEVYTVADQFDGVADVLAADIDGDEQLEIIAASMTTGRIVAWNSERQIGEQAYDILATGLIGIRVLKALDLDDDGDMDLLAGIEDTNRISWLENDGAGNFTVHVLTSEVDGVQDFATGDIDDDGDLDIAAAASTGNAIIWLENDGAQQFALHTVINTFPSPQAVVLTDLNDDGRLDIAATSHGRNSLTAWYNLGNDVFLQQYVTNSLGGAGDVAAADMDNDGDIDLLATARNAGLVNWYENNGSPTWPVHQIERWFVDGMELDTGDLDADGDLDVVGVSDQGNRLYWWQQREDGSFDRHRLLNLFEGAAALQVIDLDGDSDLDILGAANRMGRVVRCENAASESFGNGIHGDMRIVFKGSVNGITDGNNVAGFDPAATDGYDPGTDIHEAPHPPSQYIRISFTHEEWQSRLGDEYMSDIRRGGDRLLDSAHVYTFEVETDQIDEEVSLFFSLKNYSGITGAVLYDAVNSEYVNLRETDTFSFMARPVSREFSLLLGDETAPEVEFLSPVENDVLDASDSHELTWTLFDGTPVRRQVIQVSLDGGVTWATLDTLSASARSFIWQPPFRYIERGKFKLIAENWAGLMSETVLSFRLDEPDGPNALFIAPQPGDTLFAGFEYPVCWSNLVIEGAQIADAALSYSSDGGASWDTVSESLGTDTLAQWAIPANMMSNRMLLKVQSVDNHGNEGSSVSQLFTVVVSELIGVYGEGWHLMSSPFIAQDMTLAGLVGDDISEGLYLAYRYSSMQGFIPSDTLNMGEGFWLGLEGTGEVPVDFRGLPELDSTVLPLQPNWNLVGTAEPLSLSLDHIRITDGEDWKTWTTAVDDGWISGALYGYDHENGSYSQADTLRPLRGYWLHAHRGGLFMVTYLSSPENLLARQNDENGDVDEDWYVPIVLRQGSRINQQAGFGVHSLASEGYDARYDLPSAPVGPEGTYLRSTLNCEGWNIPGTDQFNNNRIGPLNAGESFTWPFVLESSEDGDVYVSFVNAVEVIPQGYSLQLSIGGEWIDLDDLAGVTVDLTSEEPVIMEVKIMRNENDVETATVDLPTSYALESIYPNPFNSHASITVALPETANLQVRVFNMMGQQVDHLFHGTLNAGRHVFMLNGSYLASGVYIVQTLVPGHLSDAERIVLVK